jgi:hypothetical protein
MTWIPIDIMPYWPAASGALAAISIYENLLKEAIKITK